MKHMKTSIKIKKWTILLMGIAMFGCSESFLEVPPQDSVVDGNFYSTDDQVLAATATLYNLVWFDYNDKASYNIGDFRGGSAFDGYSDRDNVEVNTTPTTVDNGAAWRAFYNAVGQANSTLTNINTYSGSGVSSETKQMAIAECRFMRAMAYQFLVMNWGPVPIIKNNIDLLESPLSVRRNTVETVWQFITNDLVLAAANLPETPALEGRVTRWAAEAALAKTYLVRAGVEASGGTKDQVYLDSAKYYAKRVIDLSGAQLLSSYEDLFIYPYDNNAESLFSLQWAFSGSTAWGTQNSTPAYLTPNSQLGNGDGWGGAKGATFWMLSLYEGFNMIDASTLQGRTVDTRLKASFMLPGFEYPEMAYNDEGEVVQGYTVPDPGGTLGESQHFAYVKKYVVGRLSSAEAASQRYSHDTYMIRLADMYLTYVEAELGNSASTTNATAIEYFNAVHRRATNQDFSGALTFDDIFEERAKEFAMESMMWYDLVRLHYYNPELAYQKIEAQDRGLYSLGVDDVNDPTLWTVQKVSWDDNRYFSASSANFQLPLPAAEVSAAPNLLEDPVPYDFGG